MLKDIEKKNLAKKIKGVKSTTEKIKILLTEKLNSDYKNREKIKEYCFHLALQTAYAYGVPSQPADETEKSTMNELFRWLEIDITKFSEQPSIEYVKTCVPEAATLEINIPSEVIGPLSTDNLSIAISDLKLFPVITLNLIKTSLELNIDKSIAI